MDHFFITKQWAGLKTNPININGAQACTLGSQSHSLGPGVYLAGSDERRFHPEVDGFDVMSFPCGKKGVLFCSKRPLVNAFRIMPLKGLLEMSQQSM